MKSGSENVDLFQNLRAAVTVLGGCLRPRSVNGLLEAFNVHHWMQCGDRHRLCLALKDALERDDQDRRTGCHKRFKDAAEYRQCCATALSMLGDGELTPEQWKALDDSFCEGYGSVPVHSARGLECSVRETEPAKIVCVRLGTDGNYENFEEDEFDSVYDPEEDEFSFGADADVLDDEDEDSDSPSDLGDEDDTRL